MVMKDENQTGICQGEDGHLTNLGLSLYADFLRGEPIDLPAGLEEHVETCRYCRQELMSVTDLLDEIDQVEEVPADYEVPKAAGKPPSKRFLSLIRTAAALAAVVMVSWVIQQILDERPGRLPSSERGGRMAESQRIGPNDRAIITQGALLEGDSNAFNDQSATAERRLESTEAELYAMAFKPNPAYESIVGGRFRAARDPQVTGPELGSEYTFGDTLRFSWSPEEEDNYSLIIVDNQANDVRTVPAGAQPRLEWRIDLPPGLYYWKFIGTDHLWKAGKFLVDPKR